MPYRNGTYIAFAADGNFDVTKSDIRFYNLMKGWDLMKTRDFKFINPHEKGTTIRPWSMDETIKRTLRERLKSSKRFILLVGNTTRLDTDFVPYEIEYAIDTCELPVIVCYVNERKRISENCPEPLVELLPKSLKDRIDQEKVKSIHIPFRQRIISHAMELYDFNNKPVYSFSLFTNGVYDKIYKPGEI